MEVDPKVIKRTQETLGNIIKKPTLTDKLLSRPPFRFLHDICTAFIRATGLMKGLFSPEELNADNVKDKESKLNFLQKLVDYLSIVHGYVIPVRTMSVIAGKEPDKTNEMLYLLADIVNKGVNNDDCVMRVKRGDAQQLNKKHAPDKQGKTGPDTTKHVTQNQPKPSGVDTKKDIEDKQEKKFTREKRKVDNISTRKTSTRPKNQEADSESIQVTEPKTTPGPTGGTIADCSGRQSVQPQDASVRPDSRNGFTMEGLGEEEARSTESTQPMVRPSSAKGMRSRKEEPAAETLPSEEDQQRPIITPNARLAPPRPKRNHDQLTEGGGMINGPLGSAVSTLIIPESHHESDDADDDQFVVEETIRDRCNLGPFTVPGDEEDKGDHGGLVSKMLQSKKDFETGNLLPHTKFDLKPVSHIDETARQRERAQVEKEMEKLCAALQSLSRSALPLGKLMDFVQEDLESMQQEYERWTVENQELQIRLRQEESLTQSSIDPLRSQLAELRQQCAEHRKAIASCSAKILTNEERIRDMLSRSVEIVH